MTSAPVLDLPSAPGLVLVVWPTHVIAAILPLGLMRASAFAVVSRGYHPLGTLTPWLPLGLILLIPPVSPLKPQLML